MPKARRKGFFCVREASPTAREGSRTAREVSRTVRDVSPIFRMFPGRLGMYPALPGKVPERFGKVPGRLGEFPELAGAGSKRLGMSYFWYGVKLFVLLFVLFKTCSFVCLRYRLNYACVCTPCSPVSVKTRRRNSDCKTGYNHRGWGC